MRSTIRSFKFMWTDRCARQASTHKRQLAMDSNGKTGDRRTVAPVFRRVQKKDVERWQRRRYWILQTSTRRTKDRAGDLGIALRPFPFANSGQGSLALYKDNN